MSRESVPEFTLRNAGVGPDPLSLSDIAARVDFAVLLLLRDYHCPKCKAQVQRVAEKTDKVKRRDTAVIPVLPDSHEKARRWQREYDLPFPLLADPDGDVGDSYDQSRQFGIFGRLHDVIGRLPKSVVLDLRGEPAIVDEYDGDGIDDRPPIEDLLETVDDLREEFVFDCRLVEC